MKSPEFIDSDLVSLDSNSEKSMGSGQGYGEVIPMNGKAEIDARVEKARQQMLELRRQQEELEKERVELEELRRREEEFEKGKNDLLEQLTRSVAMIEKEEFDINKRGSMLSNYRGVFQDHVRQLQEIHENEWTSNELKTQLSRAFTVIDSARADLNKGRAQLEFSELNPPEDSGDRTEHSMESAFPESKSFDFKTEFNRGLARSLPLILFGLLALLVLLLKHS